LVLQPASQGKDLPDRRAVLPRFGFALNSRSLAIYELHKLLWERLRRKHEIAETALQQAETGDRDSIATVGKLLDIEMLDPTFAAEVRAIAHIINAGKLVDRSNMSQNNYDNARGWQTKVEGGTAYIGEIHQHGTPKAES
jgi:hypothetical protein